MILLAIILTPACNSQREAEPADPKVIVGVVTEIDSGENFGAVKSFSVKRGAESFHIYVDPDVTYDFPLAHFNSHRAAAEPIRVEVERRRGILYAIAIADA